MSEIRRKGEIVLPDICVVSKFGISHATLVLVKLLSAAHVQLIALYTMARTWLAEVKLDETFPAGFLHRLS